MKNKTIQSIILLILTLIALTATVFAWFAISDTNVVDPFAINVTDYSMELTFKIKKNDEDFKEANSKQQIDIILANAKPSDEFVFNLSITFTGNVSNYQTNVLLYKIESSELLEAFYIKDGKVSVYFENNETELILEYEYLNELMDSNNNITLGNISFNPGEEKTIEFSLVFDQESEIQEKILIINSIRVTGE